VKALFTTQPAASHLDPMLPLAHELVARGWDVSVAAPEPFRATVERRGFAFHPVGLPWLESSAAEAFPELATMPLEKVAAWWAHNIFADRAGKQTARDLIELCDIERPDLIVRDYYDYGAWAVGVATAIPTVVVGLMFYSAASGSRDFYGDRLDGILEAIGLPAAENLESLHGDLYVDLIPGVYQFERPTHGVQMRAADRDVHAEPLEWVRELPEPRVLVTFGTVFNSAESLTNIVTALADEPVSMIVTTGPGIDPAALGPLPANTRAVAFADYGRLMPDCAAVVCHAGFGTVMQALAHDLPVVAVPQSADQPGHAMRCAALGAGFDLGPAPAPEAVRDAVRESLHSAEIRSATERLGEAVRGLPAASAAADAVEQLMRERRAAPASAPVR